MTCTNMYHLFSFWVFGASAGLLANFLL